MFLMDEKTRRFAANGLFPSSVYGGVGLLLAQIWAAQMHGSWQVHVFLAIPGLALTGLAVYRARLHWSAGRAGFPPLTIRSLLWYSLLFGFGVGTGVLVSAGSVLLLGLVAALSYVLPWAKIPVCRDGFVVSSVITLVGALAWIAIYSRPGHPLHYIVAAWMVFIPAMFMQSLVLVSLDPGYRIPEMGQIATPSLDVQVPLPQ
ncbi:MAG: hypothetical protein ACXWC4_06005 [Telluria sp.]